MPNPYFKVGWLSKWEQKRKITELKPNERPKEFLKKILILLDGEYYEHNYNNYKFIKYLIDKNLLSSTNMIDLYYGTLNGENKSDINLDSQTNIIIDNNTTLNNLGDLLNYFYNKGYRLIISTHHSDKLLDTFHILNKYQDLVLFNVSSSAYLENIKDIKLPNNLIRTSENDFDSLKNFFLKILPNFYSYLKTSDNSLIYNPLQNSLENEIPFNNLVYIYYPDLYAITYLNTLQLVLKIFEIKINLIPIRLTPGQSLTSEMVYYLTYNNVSSSNYITSSDKPLIFINTSNFDNLFSLFDNERYYDNYFIFTQSLKIYSSTLYKFNYAFRMTPNYSSVGYNLSINIDKTQTVYPEILSIYDLYKNIEPFFINSINIYNFNANYFISQLYNFNYLIENNWQRNLSSIQYIEYDDDSIPNENILSFSILFVIDEYLCPRAITIMKSLSKTINNNQDNTKSLEINDILLNYNENINRINILKPNLDNLLDNKFELFVSEINRKDFMNYLYNNYYKKLSSTNFTEKYVIQKTNIYQIPVINLEKKEITEYVDKKIIQDNSENLSNQSLIITLPEISYNVFEYFYDLNTNTYINSLTNLYEQEEYEEINYEIFVAAEELEIKLFRGNILRIGIYDEENEIFTTKETIRSFVTQKIHINWLIIENEYNLGDNVYIINTYQTGIVVDISDNKYYITVNISDENGNGQTQEVFSQYELFPL